MKNSVPLVPLTKKMAGYDLLFLHSLHISEYQNMLSTFRIDSCIQICEFVLD